MRSGALSKRVELWKKTSTKNEFGALSESWAKSKNLRSYTIRKSGKQTVSNDEAIDINRIRIQVRNQHNIENSDRIKYFNNMYRIDFLQPLDIKEMWLMIYCTRINE